jgi:hypothetical protein
MSQVATTCWECEARTEAPVAVALRTPVRQLGTLTLCPVCYYACYLPLARDRSEVLEVEARDVGRRLR